MGDAMPHTADRPPPAPVPAGLGPAGVELWHRLCDEYDFPPHELLILAEAAAQADAIAALRAAVDGDGTMIAGASGQRRLNSAVTELRQSRLALGRLLGMLAIPSEEDSRPMTQQSRRAQHAVKARWAKRDLRSVGGDGH